MAAILDMSQFTFDGELINSVSEMVFDDTIKAPLISAIHTVFDNIRVQKEVGFIGTGGLVGVRSQGCNPTPQDWQINTRKLVWTPVEWEVLINACYTELESTAAVYSLKTGTSIPDFTTSDYMNIVVTVLDNALADFVIRFAWFNDTEAANYSDGGVITDGLDVAYFNLIDGFFKQMVEQYTINPAQHVVIAENQGATYAAQALDPANVQGYLSAMIMQADLILRQQKDGFILCTQSYYDAYAASLQGLQLESTYTNLLNGSSTLSYNGVPLQPIPTWDVMIRSYEDSGAKLNNPHRAVYTTPNVLGIGVDDISSFSSLDVWYNRDERVVKMEAMGIADAKLTNPALFVLAM